MSALEYFRAQARALLPGSCFLHRDQQLRALFITDFPRRQPSLCAEAKQRLEENGFSVCEDRGLWRLDLSRDRQIAFIQSLPPAKLPPLQDDALPLVSLCRRLLSHGDTPADSQPWDALRLVLLRLDAGELPRLSVELSELCAVLKRKKMPLPTAAVSLVLTHHQGGC